MSNRLKFRLANCAQNGNSVEFDVFLSNTGTSGLKLNAAQFGVNIDPACLAGTPTMASVTSGYVSGSGVIPPCSNWSSPQNRASITSLRFVQGPKLSFYSQAPVLTATEVKLGRFKIASSTGFKPGTKPNLVLQNFVAGGKTVCAAVVYIDTDTVTTALQAPADADTVNESELILS